MNFKKIQTWLKIFSHESESCEIFLRKINHATIELLDIWRWSIENTFNHLKMCRTHHPDHLKIYFSPKTSQRTKLKKKKKQTAPGPQGLTSFDLLPRYFLSFFFICHRCTCVIILRFILFFCIYILFLFFRYKERFYGVHWRTNLKIDQKTVC